MKNPYCCKLRSHFLTFASAFAAFVVSASLHAADMNVLIIGSTKDGGDSFGGKSDPFVPTQIATELKSILSGVSALGTVNVVVEDRYKTASDDFGSSYSYNLASWYHWPYPAGVETTTRWPNLRGELGTVWDYVVLIGDPYTMENMPGHYAHGVEMIAQEVAKGSAEVILLMPWPAPLNNTSSVAHYKEVVYRTGRTGGYKVAPAGLAWQADGSTSTVTPQSARGAYICASSIYSSIWGQSAAASTYTYNDTLADLVNTTVTNNVNAVQYSGNKMNFQSPFLMLEDKRRDVHYSEKGSSTEQYYKEGATRAMDRARVNYDHASYCDKYDSSTPADDGLGWPGSAPLPIAWNHGRDGSDLKSYVVNPAVWQLAWTFDFQDNSEPWPDDEANDICLARIFSHELGLASSLKSGDSSERLAAWRLMWGQIHKLYPNEQPTRDTQFHVNRCVEDAVGAFMYTIYSGRCPVTPGEESTLAGYARRVGYETAWRLGTCSARAPGFKVMPSIKSALTVTPTTSETMTVQFLMQPRNNVTVQVSSSNTSAAIVGPQTLVFTPSNYNVPQSITVKGVTGSTASAPFNVVYTTTSDDPAYNGLSDSWAYTTTRTATTVSHVDNGTTQYSTSKNFPVTTNLNAAGATSANTIFAGPNNGTLSWSGSDVVYTPSANYVGPDGFAYSSLNGTTLKTGYIAINVIDGYPIGSVRAEAADSTATEQGVTTGRWSIIREGSTASNLPVYFALGGTATAGDYSVSATSPITIPAGQSSVTVTLTPVNDSVREFSETVTLTITTNANYTAITNPAAITIQDNDNSPPAVNAGPDLSLTLNNTTAWTPASTTTKAWYDAADATTITATGTAVTSWNDKSGNNYHIAGATGREPVTGSRTINGLNTVDFQSGDVLAISSRLGFGVNPSIMAFLVMKVDSTGGDTGAVFVFGSGTNKLRTATFNNEIGWYYEGGNEKYGSVTTSDPIIGCWQRPSGGNYASASFYQNGTELTRTAGSNDTLSPTDSSSVFSLGADSDNSSFLDAAVAEAVFIESNDVALRQNMEGYLAHKWGLTANLPSSHPYKSGAPGAASITATLDGTVSDTNGDTLTTVWSVVSTNPTGLPIAIANASAVDTTATFYGAGTYVLRLTANDGTDVVTDDVTITVTSAAALPAISVSATDASASETGPDTGSWTFTRTGSTAAALQVFYTIAGTATSGSDFTALTTSVTFPIGASTVTRTLTPTNDSEFEGNETVVLALATGAEYAITMSNSAMITIADDDKPTVTIAATDTVCAEAATADVGVFTLSRTGILTSALTVNYTAGGLALNGTDYTALTGSVTFAANTSTATITITPTHDTDYEGSEDVAISISANASYLVGSPGSATLSIADNDKPTISVAGTVTAASETGPVNGLLTFTRTGWTGSEFNVPIAITGTALGGSDYTALPTSITFAANSSTATLSIPVINDTDFEVAETVIVTISTNAAYTVASSPNHTSTVTISDNDKPTVTVAVTDAACLETSSNDGVFTLTRTGTTVAALTVNYTLTGAAINGTDYTLRTGSVIFAANGATATVSIDPFEDSEYEDHETVTLNISPDTAYIVGAASSDSLTITDNDKPTVSVAASATTLTEGGSGSVLTFTRTGINSLGSLTVFYAPSGTATVGSDYALMAGTIIIPQGQASATVNVTILQDNVTEVPETLIVTVSTNAAYNAAVSPNDAANLTVLDDNEAVAVNIAVTDSYASEPSKGDGTGLYTITRSGSTTAALSVNILTTGTATQGSDYSTLPSSVTIPAGQTSATVTITPTDDSEAEVDEIVTVTLQAGSGYSIGATSAANINLYDDEATQVRVEVSDAKCLENSTDNGVFTLRRLGDRTAALTVNYTRTGTATSGSDFTAFTSPATITAGNPSVTITVAPLNDALVEGTETVILTLATGTGYTINAQNSGTLEIRDDETVDVTISAQEPNCAEQSTPDTGNFRITRSATAATSLTVSYTIAGTANNGTDYTTISGTATILANAAYADILITPTNDGILEGSESIILTLTGAGSTYDIGDARTATIWIKDDETPSITLAATDAAAAEADGATTNQGLYTFTSSLAPASNLTINYTVSTNNGIDCTFLPGSIVLPAGQTSVTLAVVPIDDELPEGAENITVTLAYGGSYNLTTTAGVNVSIAASDTPVATITALDSNAVENPVKTGRFIVTLSKVVAGNTTVKYTVSGTATATSDYTALGGTVTINAGTNSSLITVTPLDDALAEGTETIVLTLSLNGTAYTIGSPSSDAVNIADDEAVAPLTAWKESAFGVNSSDPTIAGDTIDYDQDGLPNLLEYAFGSDPTTSTAGSQGAQANTSTGALTLSFNRVVDHNDITIVIQAADDLNNTWTDIASSINGSPTASLTAGVVVTETGTGSTRSVSVTDSYTTNDPAHPRRFMRIKVSN